MDSFCPDERCGTLVPVFRDLPADLETPVSAFLKLGGASPSFLLESVEGGKRLGRYSFMGTNPSLVLRCSGDEGLICRDGEVSKIPLGPGGTDPLHLVERLLSQRVMRNPDLPRFFGGAVGYLSYDVVRFLEKLPLPSQDELGLPDSIFLFTNTLVIFDHVEHKMKVVCNIPAEDEVSARGEAQDKLDEIVTLLQGPLPSLRHPASPGETSQLTSNFTEKEFCHLVEEAKGHIFDGDAFQIVLSQRLRRQTRAKPFSIYRALRMLNPSPYMFYLDFGDFQLIGSSPEMLVRLTEGRAEARPIAGTRPRGRSEGEDQRLIKELLGDPKERAEHIMLVDLGRNDLGRVCRFGTVKVPLLMGIEKYSHVIHIVSSVEGALRENCDAFSLARSSFPAGTVSGAPKIRAMEIISELEGTRRGPYAGAVGYFGFGGNMDTCIAIRTIVMVGDTVYFQGGAGIVADSDPEREYQESLKKIEVLERAVRLAEGSHSEEAIL